MSTSKKDGWLASVILCWCLTEEWIVFLVITFVEFCSSCGSSKLVFFWPLYLFDCRMHSAWLACWLVALGTIERRTAFKTCDRQC